MKTFQIITDTEVFYVHAEDQREAAQIFIREEYPEKLDDELPDLFDIEEVTKPGIFFSTDR